MMAKKTEIKYLRSGSETPCFENTMRQRINYFCIFQLPLFSYRQVFDQMATLIFVNISAIYLLKQLDIHLTAGYQDRHLFQSC